MDRRTVLSGCTALAVGGLAGCVSDGAGEEGTGDDGAGNDGDTPEWSETATADERTPGNGTTTDPATERTAPPPATAVTLVDSSLTVRDVECGEETDDAAVRFDGETERVVVTGTIWGSDACRIPVLADASYDAQADALSVTVTTGDRGGGDRGTDDGVACAQCVTELDYRTTHSFEGGLPGSVSVRHDRGDGGDVVATATSE